MSILGTTVSQTSDTSPTNYKTPGKLRDDRHIRSPKLYEHEKQDEKGNKKTCKNVKNLVEGVFSRKSP